MTSELIFVNVSGSPDNGDPSNSKTVRSHVIKHYRKQKKEESRRKDKGNLGRYKSPFYDTGIFSKPAEAQEKAFHSTAPRYEAPPSVGESSSTESSLDATDNDGVGEIVRFEQPSRSPNIKEITSLAFMDVDFNAYNFLPISASPRALKLIHASMSSCALLDWIIEQHPNFCSVIRTSVHADPSENYLSYYVDNAARLYMVLSYAASRSQKRCGNGPSESACYFMKAISAVNNDIADPEKQASDATIATVCSMANVENLNGNPENAVLHLNGLKRMVEMRGGLHCLGMHGILRRVVLWADLCGASRTQTVPMFPLVDFPNMPPLSTFSQPSCARLYILNLNESLLAKASIQEHVKMISTFQKLHELSTFLNLAGKETEDLPIAACYPDRVYSVEDNLVTALAISRENVSTQHNDIWDVFRHVSLLYIYTNLRQTPVGGRIRESLSNRLRICMQRIDLEGFRKDLPAELLWILCIGLAGSQDTSDYQWFLCGMERVCMEYLIGSWEELVEFCGVMPVLERACARKCQSLWSKNIFSNGQFNEIPIYKFWVSCGQMSFHWQHNSFTSWSSF
ncbi:hypothetical protein VTL71DRAFT_13134 [Oculimacula yallundae]|uniref:Uncharacterized protein n=1 Tax=Oculimacula yallundae TaxID=86028 RepID=A0ABR4CS48_9HELO